MVSAHDVRYPMNENKDYYAILGVLSTAEDIVIQGAYRALAQRYHPDRFGGDPRDATSRMAELNEAYGILSDAVQRSKYDRARKVCTVSSADSESKNGFSSSALRFNAGAVGPHMSAEVELYLSFAEKLHEWGYPEAKIQAELLRRGVPLAAIEQLIRIVSRSA